MVKNWAWSLGQDDPLEKGMATHSRSLAWKIPWTEEPGGLQSMGLQRVRHIWMTNTFTNTLNKTGTESPLDVWKDSTINHLRATVLKNICLTTMSRVYPWGHEWKVPPPHYISKKLLEHFFSFYQKLRVPTSEFHFENLMTISRRVSGTDTKSTR